MRRRFFILVVLIWLVNCCAYPELLLGNRKDIRLIDVEKGKLSKQVIVKGVHDATSVDYYYKGQMVCYTDIDEKLIKCVSFNRTSEGIKDHTEVMVISRGIISPDGLAVDWLGEKIYWADSDGSRIEVAELYSPIRRVLYWQDLGTPRAVALVPAEGLMFWTDWGENPKIERAGMDGSLDSRKVIVGKDINWPNGLTVDLENRIVYWVDAKLSYIASVDFEGKNRKKVIQGEMPHPFSLVYFDYVLYWTDWKTKAIHYCHLENKKTCEKQQHLNMSLTPMYVQVYDRSRQPHADTPCQHNNGGCSHLCLAAPYPRNFSCSCPTGIKLRSEFECHDGPEEIIILARRADIRIISLDTPDHTPVVFPVSGVKHATAVDYDPVDGFVYWTDDETCRIERAKLDGTEQETVISVEVLHPDGIAVDWVARNLYWSDTGNDKIQVSRLDGKYRKVLLVDNLDEPRAITLDPDGGLMFWTDWGIKTKIERSALDGSMREQIVTENLGWPNGIVIDTEFKRIYWCDAKNDIIELPDLMGLKAVNMSIKFGNNPCANNNGGCSHLCFNRPRNNFTCDCPIEYELKADGKTCIVPNAFLIYAEKNHINQVSLNTSRSVSFPVTGIQGAASVDFDSYDKRLYWTDTTTKAISRVFMNGSNLEHIIEFGLQYPEGMAVDWLSRNIYWTDFLNNRIEAAKLDGSSRRVLIWDNITNPSSLALDPTKGFMFWSEWGTQFVISRANLDGSKAAIIIYDIGKSNGLTTDMKEERLFWTDIDKQRIESSDFNGHKRIDRVDYVTDIHMFYDIQTSFKSPCIEDNGRCSHLCLVSTPVSGNTYSHKCSCPTHFFLSEDNRTCLPPESFLLFSQKNYITRLILDESDCPTLILPIHNMKNIQAIEYDPVDQAVYWVDKRAHAIRKAYENGTTLSFLAKFVDKVQPFDLVLDPFTRILIWSCALNNVINITRLNGFSVGSLLNANSNDEPRYLAFHPFKAFLYFVNIVKSPKIECIHLDGLLRYPLVEDLNDPIALTVDYVDDFVIWMHSGSIERISLDGTNRVTLLQGEPLQETSLVVYENYIYFLDSTANLIERIDKYTGSKREKLLTRINHLSDILAVSPLIQKALMEHPCTKGSSCSHLCLKGEIGEQVCGCPDTYTLSDDQKTCISRPVCQENEFLCNSGSVGCIPMKWRCDGQIECSDRSDEQNCPASICHELQFSCSVGGQCLDFSQVCDGTPQCEDHSDELECCKAGQVLCQSTGDCIYKEHLCSSSHICPDEMIVSHCRIRGFVDIESESSKAAYIVGGVVSIVVLLCVAALVIYYRKQPAVVDEAENEAQHSKSVHSTRQYRVVLSSGKAYSGIKGEPSGYEVALQCLSSQEPCTSVINCSSNNRGLLDHNPPVGASSSSSSITHYPREPLNPPPTPIAEPKSRCKERHCCHHSYIPLEPPKLSYRHYKSHNRPPPPTPCSTDICDDSDFCSSTFSPARPSRCYVPGSTNFSPPPFTDYDSDPCPPPPTPQTQYCTSCPSSPCTTERSFFSPAPCPPPPSPIASD